MEETPTGTVAVTDTTEVITDAPPAPAVVVEEEEGIDESWLEEHFASVRQELTNLSTLVSQNQAQNLETINRLMVLVTEQQATMATMVEKLSAMTASTPPQPPAVTVTEVETVTPANLPPPSSSNESPAAATEREAPGRVKRVRKI